MNKLLAALLISIAVAHADQPPAHQPMTAARPGELIQRIDPDAKQSANAREFDVDSYLVAVVYDEAADRIRILIPVRSIRDLGEAELLRDLGTDT